MSYVTKYTLEYPNWFGSATKVYIKERDYAGASTDVKGSTDPLVISLLSTDDEKLDVIKGSVATVEIMSETDFQFTSLFTADKFKYQVEVERNSVTIWKGYLLPDEYSEPYASPPYAVSITASDGLGLLKNIPFMDGDSLVTGKKTIMEAITICLEKIGLTDLKIYEGISLYEDNMNSTTSDSVLEQTYFDAEAFVDIDTPVSCYEVIEALLKPFGAKMMQSASPNNTMSAAAAWYIVRDVEDTGFHLREFTYGGGAYGNTDDAALTLREDATSATVAKSSYCRFLGNNIMFLAAWKELNIKQDYRLIDNIITDGEFSYWDNDTTPTYWNLDLSPAIERSGDTCRLTSDTTFTYATTGYIFQTFDVTVTTDQDIEVSVDYAVESTVQTLVNVMLAIWDGLGMTYSNFYWWNGYNWVNTPARIVVTVPASNTGSNKGKVEFRADEIPVSGQAWLGLYEPTAGTTSYCYFDNASVKLVPAILTDVFYKDLDYNLVINENNNKMSDIEISMGDIVDPGLISISYDNMPLIYHGSFYYVSGGSYYNTSAWSESGWSGSHTLANVLSFEVADQYTNPSQLVSGRLYTELLGFVDRVRDINNNSKEFIINRGDYHDEAGYWDIDMYEKTSASPDYLLQEIGDKILQETADKIII